MLVAPSPGHALFELPNGLTFRATFLRRETLDVSLADLLSTIRVSDDSSPFLAKFVQSSSLQVVRRHGNPKLDISLKGEEPRFCQRGNLRWV